MTPLTADALLFAAAACYVLATVVFFRRLFTDGVAVKVGVRLLAAGVALHAAEIVVASLVLRVCPVEGVHFPVSVSSMAMGLVYLAVRRKYRVDVAGAFVAPLALTALLASKFVGGAAGEAGHIKSVVLPVHVLVTLVGLALFALAFAVATLYLVQERLLKQKRIEGLFQRLPPLDSLDRAEHRLLLLGFPLLTLGILTGTLWAGRVDTTSFFAVLRATFGYVTWLLFAGVLFLRAAAGWRGRRAAYGTIAGFSFAMLVLLVYWLRAAADAGGAA